MSGPRTGPAPETAQDRTPTCRHCWLATLTPDQRQRASQEPITSTIYLCPEHQAAEDTMLANLAPHFIKAAALAAPSAPQTPAGEGWRHARWTEPHLAQADPNSIERRRAHPDYDTAACLTCGEILLPAAPSVVPADPARERQMLLDAARFFDGYPEGHPKREIASQLRAALDAQ